MERYAGLDEHSVDILKELGNIGTGNAVTSLSQMMDHPLQVESPDLKIVSYREMAEAIAEVEELQTGIIVEIYGELKGMFLFLLSETFTKDILDILLEKKERDITELDDMEKSLICELGNIMCGSYIRALVQLLNMELDVSVPGMCVDMGGAILSVPVARFLKISDTILLINNTFRMDGKAFLGRILFLPEQESLEAMLENLRGT